MTQKEHFQVAHRKVADANNLFIEIQRSDNPITKEDFDKLVKRWPDFWLRFERFFVDIETIL